MVEVFGGPHNLGALSLKAVHFPLAVIHKMNATERIALTVAALEEAPEDDPEGVPAKGLVGAPVGGFASDFVGGFVGGSASGSEDGPVDDSEGAPESVPEDDLVSDSEDDSVGAPESDSGSDFASVLGNDRGDAAEHVLEDVPESVPEGVLECELEDGLEDESEGGPESGWTGANVPEDVKVTESAPKAENDWECDSGDFVHEDGDWLVQRTLPVMEVEVSLGPHVALKLAPDPEVQKRFPGVLEGQDSGQVPYPALHHLKDLVRMTEHYIKTVLKFLSS